MLESGTGRAPASPSTNEMFEMPLASARLAATETQLAAGLVAAYQRWLATSERVAALQKDIVPAQERAAALESDEIVRARLELEHDAAARDLMLSSRPDGAW